MCLSSHPFFAQQIFRTRPCYLCKCRAVRAWGKGGGDRRWGGSAAALAPHIIGPGAQVRMSASSYLVTLPPRRKFEFNPKLGIDNPVLSLVEDHDLSGNPLTPWATPFPRDTRLYTAPRLLGNPSL